MRLVDLGVKEADTARAIEFHRARLARLVVQSATAAEPKAGPGIGAIDQCVRDIEALERLR